MPRGAVQCVREFWFCCLRWDGIANTAWSDLLRQAANFQAAFVADRTSAEQTLDADLGAVATAIHNLATNAAQDDAETLANADFQEAQTMVQAIADFQTAFAQRVEQWAGDQGQIDKAFVVEQAVNRHDLADAVRFAAGENAVEDWETALQQASQALALAFADQSKSRDDAIVSDDKNRQIAQADSDLERTQDTTAAIATLDNTQAVLLAAFEHGRLAALRENETRQLGPPKDCQK